MSRVVILGDGLLGSTLYQLTGWDQISRKKDGFDITKPDKFFGYFFDIFDGMAATPKYDTIVNCIANTKTYSKDKEEHWDVNYKGVVDLTDFCKKWKIKLVHISTDYIYTNSKKNVSENDIPIHGENWYTYTKLLGDAYVQLKSENNLICRGTHKPKPFAFVQAWEDQFGNFDYVNKISEIIIKLVEKKAKGVFNVGTEVKSMYELAIRTAPNCLAWPTPSHVPKDLTMDLTKLKDFLKNE
jgi:dTDP-4-dehydrorhamnose reductase